MVVLIIVTVGINCFLINGYLDSDKRAVNIYNNSITEYNAHVEKINNEYDKEIRYIESEIASSHGLKYVNYVNHGCEEGVSDSRYYDCADDKPLYNEINTENEERESEVHKLEEQKELEIAEIIKPIIY